MTARFVLDECSWQGAARSDTDVLSNAIHELLDRLDVARERNEGVVMHADYYETALGDGVRLYSALFEPTCPVQLDHDLAERLYVALDRINEFSDSQLIEYDAQFGGTIQLAPGVTYAHACCSKRHHVGVLPIGLDGVPHGRVSVTVADTMIDLFFVTEESEHVSFFRAVISLENADKAMFERLARSAFPALGWADNVWRGLGNFDRPYIDVRDELVRYLGGLSDHGAKCFHEHLAGDQSQLANVLSARVGCGVSDENGRTKNYRPSERDRTRRHRGINKVFWWHVKLQPHVDRIHFLYESPSINSSLPDQGRIVVGIFKDHCILPN